MKIITAGKKYTDIDAYSSVIAYAKLLNMQGEVARAVLTEPLNESISSFVRTIPVEFEDTYNKGDYDNPEFVIIDVSDPKYIASFVLENRIVEIYDHHFGFENYWKQKLGEDSHVETIGSCTTQAWEQYKARGCADKISKPIAQLLYITTVVHTLNLQVQFTQNRDLRAVEDLKPIADLSDGWMEKYYAEVEASFYKDPIHALENDTKHFTAGGTNYAAGQVELYDSKKFLDEHAEVLDDFLASIDNAHSFLIAPSIKDGVTYFLTQDQKVKESLEHVLGAAFDDAIAKTERLMLRKEVVRELG